MAPLITKNFWLSSQADSAGTESSEIIAYIQCIEDIFHPSLKYRGETGAYC